MPDVNELIDVMDDDEFKRFAYWHTATLLLTHLDFDIAQPACNKLTKAYNGLTITTTLLAEIVSDIAKIEVGWKAARKELQSDTLCPDAELGQLFKLALSAIRDANIHTHRFKYTATLRLFMDVRAELVKFMEERHSI
jgi:hypothetical protein